MRSLHRRRGARFSSLMAIGAAAGLLLSACGGETGDSKTEDTSTATQQSETSADGDTTAGEATTGTEPVFVYGVFATPLEEPWDGAIHTALEAVAAEGLIRYEYVDSIDTPDTMENTLRDIAENQQPDLIIGDAFSAEAAVRTVAAEFPDIAFAFGSGEAEVAPNLSVFDNWIQDPAYLAGMLAGGLTKTNTIGVVAAMPIPEVNRIVNGFIEGVKATNPAATVKVSFINSFFDPATAKTAAEAQIAAGADVLFAERDGVIAAAQEAKLPVVGMMVDQKDQAPQNVVTSLLWDMKPTVLALVDQISSGTYTASNLGQYSFMKNGGSSIAPINTDLVVEVPADLVAQVEAKQAEIEAGTFAVEINEEAPAGSTDVSAGE
ncbi:MAG: BMP family protein [Bifidobacteriaceae bacterium]|jgi:basic membrane lipoprotein Med (substrate-binding protein (PBP1-ABC) superfamily)|nr:BMP family protein [Bifidobacteriaceae bacterium]